MPNCATCVADGGVGALASNMPWLVAIGTCLAEGALDSDVPWLEAVIAEHRACRATTSQRGPSRSGDGALARQVAYLAACVADGVKRALPCDVARLVTVGARLWVAALSSNVSWFEAVVAELCAGHHATHPCSKARALPGKVPRLATGVAHGCIRTLSGLMTRLLAVVAQGITDTIGCQVPR